MLQRLRVRNLALMDEVELEFEPGFVAVTGETGAGKSILLGALSLLAGNRAEKSVIRQQAAYGEVEAQLFFADASAMDDRLAALDLPPCEEGVLLLSRRLERDKGPRIAVNGRLTTLANLRVLGEAWIDFHGPGEPQKLFQPAFQLQCLDEAGEAMAERRAVESAFREWQALRREMRALEEEGRLSDAELAFLQEQIGAIESLELSAEAVAEKEARFQLLGKAREIAASGERIQAFLDGPDGAVSSLQRAWQEMRQLADDFPAAAPLGNRLRGLIVESEDVSQELQALLEGLDLQPQEVAALEEWMRLWMGVRRKHGGSLEKVLSELQAMRQKVELQGDLEGALLRKEKALSELEKDLKAKAKKLTAKRVKTARSLDRKVGELLPRLGFKHARFAIEVQEDQPMRAEGDSICCFRFSANPGSEPLPIEEIASSGETARLMLALKTVMAGFDETPVLVFDEVDANVGGEVAGEVAAELKRLGQRHQVFCVTHLPQVAAVAGSHFIVAKHQTTKATSVSIEALTTGSAERQEEIARMLGDRRSKTALQHAGELLGEGRGKRQKGGET